LPEEERDSYVHSPQCKVCNAKHDGRNIRSEIEALVIERKTHGELCDIIFARYALELAPHNISRHMARHAPGYTEVLNGLLQSKFEDVLAGAVGPIIDDVKYLFSVVQVAFHNLLVHPEQVTVADGIRAADKLAQMPGYVESKKTNNMVTQEEITDLLDIMQGIMTREQVEEAKRRYLAFRNNVESSEPCEEPDNLAGAWVDGEFVTPEDIPTLPPKDPEVDNE